MKKAAKFYLIMILVMTVTVSACTNRKTLAYLSEVTVPSLKEIKPLADEKIRELDLEVEPQIFDLIILINPLWHPEQLTASLGYKVAESHDTYYVYFHEDGQIEVVEDLEKTGRYSKAFTFSVGEGGIIDSVAAWEIFRSHPKVLRHSVESFEHSFLSLDYHSDKEIYWVLPVSGGKGIGGAGFLYKIDAVTGEFVDE
jgi:hypothetical protein